MRIASNDAPHRESYISVARGVSVPFQPDAKPEIVWNHIDGPLLYLRNGQLHWLTLWERFLCWIGSDDAFTLEQKRAPDFVRRWNERSSRHAENDGPQ